MKRFFWMCVILSVWMVAGCQSTAELPAVGEDVPVVAEQPVIEIPLAGAVSVADAEISSLTWYGEWLILLPQYPSVVGGSIYALPKGDIVAFLDGSLEGPLTPQAIAVDSAGLEGLPNYEGLEGIVFVGETAYLTVETDQGSEMAGYLLQGEIAADLSRLTVNTADYVIVPPQAPIDNYSEESVLYYEGEVMTLYEANGQNVNNGPVYHRFDAQLNPLENRPFPFIEYRVTDATAVDADGRFWAVNFIFEGSIDKLDPAPDPLFAQYGIGETHKAQGSTVERLVEMEITAEGIVMTDRAPIQLELLSDGTARNWEGVVRLDERGVLLATDKFPGTVLGFVSLP